MNATGLRCSACGRAYGLEAAYACAGCGGILEVTYDYERLRGLNRDLYRASPFGMNYALLPVEECHTVRLGEGWTPLVAAPRVASEIGVDRLLLKCEHTNPTGSFKDRSIAVGTGKAVESGFRKLIVASSGNGAAAVSAYAARAGLEAIVLVSEGTSAEKIRQTQFCGARVLRVQGPYSNSYALADALAKRYRLFNLTTTFNNPYAVEGNKTIAFELCEQLRGDVPDAVFVPVGAGPMLVGILRGYLDYRELGLVDRMPHMMAVQAEGCCPVVRAFRAGGEAVREVTSPKTVAGGICDGLVGYAENGSHTLRHVRMSGGLAVAVSDEEILGAQRLLALREGIFVEPTGAAGLAGLIRARRDDAIPAGGSVVVILSGHGLKDVNALQGVDAPLIPPDVEAAARQFGLDRV
jgi:threonine synthase